jgi:hypothetical protein
MRIDDPRPRDIDFHHELSRPDQTRATTSTRSASVRRDFPETSSDRDPPELLAFYAGLRAQAARTTRADAALPTTSPESAGQSRMNALRDAFSGPYTVNGQQVIAPPMFRLSRGANQESMRAHAAKLDSVASSVRESGAGMRLGCATPRALVKVTQALINAGKLPDGPGDLSARIRQMQWTWGIGVDCAAYTRQAFLTANGLSEKDTERLGVLKMGEEAFRDLDRNQHFDKVAPADVRTGDIITLDAKPGGEWGHNLCVHSNVVGDSSTIEAFARQHGSAARAFLQGLGPYHFIQVDSSFGAGPDGAEYGGYRRDTWIYDASTREWGYLDPTSSPPSFEVSKSGPASDDVYHGAYRVKAGT